MPDRGFQISYFKFGIWHLAFGIVLLGLTLGLVRLTGPDDLADNEQLRTAACVSDLLLNQHFICQRDEAGQITSKPPMYTWLAALCEWPLANATTLAMKIPALAATLTMGVVLMCFAAKHMGNRAGCMAGFIYFISLPIVKQAGLARMDSTFAVFVGLGTLAAYRAWTTGKGWIWFWLAVAVSTLCKGPLGPMLSAVGLLAAMYLRGQDNPRQRSALGNITGTIIFLVITLGWFLLAIKAMGPDVYDKLINQEFLAQSLQKRKGIMPGTHLWEPAFLFLTRFLPFGLLSFLGLYRYIIRPPSERHSYRLQAFLFWSLLGGMLIIGLGTHQRGDLLLPLYPPAALIAAAELDRLTKTWQPKTMISLAVLTSAPAVAGFFYNYHIAAKRLPAIQLTTRYHAFADQLLATAGSGFPFTHCDDSFAVNFFLHTMRPLHLGPTQSSTGITDENREVVYDYDASAKLLTSPAAAYVIVENMAELERRLPKDCTIYDLTPPTDNAEPHPHVISNWPTLGGSHHMILGDGPLIVETRDLNWLSATANRFEFSGNGTVAFINNGAGPVTITTTTNGRTQTLVLPPHGR